MVSRLRDLLQIRRDETVMVSSFRPCSRSPSRPMRSVQTWQHPAAKRALVEACRHPDDATQDAAARALRTGDTHLSDVRDVSAKGETRV